MVSHVVPQNLLGGAWVGSSSGAVLERRSPRGTGEVWSVPASSEDDVDRAVRAATAAQPAWAATTPVRRGEVVRAAAELLRDRRDQLVAAVCAETGKPPRDARGELGGAIEMAYFVAGEGRRMYGRTTTSATPNKRVSFVRAPIGVAGLIVASNTPLPNYAWKVFPALVAGNAAVLKPSEDTPASAQLFAELMVDAGVPSGVLNVVHGRGPEAGAAVAAHPGVDIVSFTGSVAAGRSINAVAGERLAKVCLELGGKNPLVVCEDADLDGAVQAAVLSAFSNAGQRCAAGSRLIVVDEVYEEFRSRLIARTEALQVGSDDEADLGPVINERQLERMLATLRDAEQQGAKVLTGGERLTGGAFDGGCFLAPTLLESAGEGTEIDRTEMFGPISVLHRVPNFARAIEVANDSPFGLTAALWTTNVHRAMVFADTMQAGMVVVNGPTYGSEPHMPFGGFRQSGNGFREAGTEALDVYTDWKTVSILHDPAQV